MPRLNSGSWPTRTTLDAVPGVPPPGATVLSPCAGDAVVRTRDKPARATTTRYLMSASGEPGSLAQLAAYRPPGESGGVHVDVVRLRVLQDVLGQPSGDIGAARTGTGYRGRQRHHDRAGLACR